MNWKKNDRGSRCLPNHQSSSSVSILCRPVSYRAAFSLTLASFTLGEKSCKSSLSPARPSSLGPRSAPGLCVSSGAPHPAGLRCPLPPDKGRWGEGQAVPRPLLPQHITHLSSQVLQGAKDFTDYVSGEVGAAAPLQAPVTNGRAIKLGGSSHDTFSGCPRQHQSALTTDPSLDRFCRSAMMSKHCVSRPRL